MAILGTYKRLQLGIPSIGNGCCWTTTGEFVVRGVMKFDDLDAKMRVFETALDFCVLPEMHMVARLDGRSFTRLTKEKQNFEAPFDERFRDLMVATAEHLMDCGFRMVYGYTESDEISLLFHRDSSSSIASCVSSTRCWQARPGRSSRCCWGTWRVSTAGSRSSQRRVGCDYFRWRSADAARNA